MALATLAALPLLPLGPAPRAQARGQLITRDEAARWGLVREWFAQIPVDPALSRVNRWKLYFGTLYSVSDSGLVTALDAETGRALWTKQVGRTGFPAFGPGVNAKYIGIVSGAKLYMLENATGRLVWARDLGSAPASGPALSRTHAYVALATGRIEGYPLDEPEKQPWFYQSSGRTFNQPTTTGSVVSWPTSTGSLYVCKADKPAVEFRTDTGEEIVTDPAESEPWLYFASLDGYLYCVDERTGREAWRYATGFPITSSPAIVGKRAFVASLEPALHVVDSEQGDEQWVAVGASHFAAQGKERVYASDRYGNLLILDGKTGRRLGGIRSAEGLETIVNDQNDRIYLANSVGLVQCLREEGAEKPTPYRKSFEAGVAAEEAAAAKKKEPSTGASPFEESGEPASAPDAAAKEQAEAPAEEKPAEEAPAEAPAKNANPFEDF